MAFVAMLTDYAENLSSFLILSYSENFAQVPDGLISFFIMANFCKFASLAVTLVVFVRLLVKWLQKGKGNKKNVMKKR